MSSLLEDDKNYVWHPFTQMKTAPIPLAIVKANGIWLYTEDGKKYMDVNSSWWVNVHGHGNDYIGQAIAKQFVELDHVIFAGATHPKAVELSKRLCQLLGDPFSKVFFSDDGSTAVEVALKMVLQYYYNKGDNRKRILALEGAYHGDTFGAMSVGQRGYFNKPFEHLFFDVDFLDFPTEENEVKLLEEAETLFKSNEFAGLIVEPLVQGSAGMRMYSRNFLDELVSRAKQYNVKVIFDEIMTGWGRTGRMFAKDYCNETPDIVCVSKGLTGGVLPLGLTVATDEIYNAFLDEDKLKALLHGHSFTGNALACAAACASMDLFEQESTIRSIKQLTEWNAQQLNLLNKLERVKEARSLGTILAVELETGEGNTYFSNIRDEAYNFFLENGILLRPLGNILFINPPYCITKEEYKEAIDKLYTFIKG